jgi:general stress protein 26
LAFSGRHLIISVWFITQKYNAVVKDFRDNIRALVQFYEKDEDSLKAALSENGVIPKE